VALRLSESHNNNIAACCSLVRVTVDEDFRKQKFPLRGFDVDEMLRIPLRRRKSGGSTNFIEISRRLHGDKHEQFPQ